MSRAWVILDWLLLLLTVKSIPTDRDVAERARVADVSVFGHCLWPASMRSPHFRRSVPTTKKLEIMKKPHPCLEDPSLPEGEGNHSPSIPFQVFSPLSVEFLGVGWYLCLLCTCRKSCTTQGVIMTTTGGKKQSSDLYCPLLHNQPHSTFPSSNTVEACKEVSPTILTPHFLYSTECCHYYRNREEGGWRWKWGYVCKTSGTVPEG